MSSKFVAYRINKDKGINEVVCGDGIKTAEEECDGGVGCLPLCQCAEGWERTSSKDCIPKSGTKAVAFQFQIFMEEKSSIYNQRLFRKELQSEIYLSMSKTYEEEKRASLVHEDDITVAKLSKDEIKSLNPTIQVKLTSKEDSLVQNVKMIHKLVTNHSSWWYDSNSTFLRYISPNYKLKTNYTMDESLFDGSSHIMIVVLLSLIVLFI